MALDTFRFTMFLPADADLLPLIREVSEQMARYVGLPEDNAQAAREGLERAVAERLREPAGAAGDVRSIRVTFERRTNASTATVEVTWDAPPREAPEDGPAGTRFSWQVHEGE
jgi:hypothetical protein